MTTYERSIRIPDTDVPWKCIRCGKCCHFHNKLPCGAHIKTRCVHLSYDDNGLASCDIHETKPETCKRWRCMLTVQHLKAETEGEKQRLEAWKKFKAMVAGHEEGD